MGCRKSRYCIEDDLSADTQGKTEEYSTWELLSHALRGSTTVISLAALTSCRAMYTFVFMWTPAMTTEGEKDLPFGLIFAVFMVVHDLLY